MLTTVNFFMKMYCIWLGEQNLLGCILCNLEYFSEFKMAVSAILNFGKFSTFDLDDIEGRVLPLFKGFPGWRVHF